MAVARGPMVVAERRAGRGRVLGGWRTRILVLVSGRRSHFRVRKRSRRAIDRELLEPHLRVADTLRRIVFNPLVEPGAPALPSLFDADGGIVVGSVTLLVALRASLGLFKARSACN